MERESDEASATVRLRSVTKRLKTVPSPRSKKGKEKSEADPHSDSNPTPEEEEERCGICLTGSTQSIRGVIDSCNHHFCYVCVMEWAKIESRCPLCKKRFGSVRRPAVPGLFPSERVLKISERDQVYHPLGIESSAVNNLHYLDPNCTVCHSSEKDAYLLLCELCNSTCHTYCIGLKSDIPEGEWYCSDCTLVRKNECLKSPFPDQETKEKIRKIREGGSSISISDFVPYTVVRDVTAVSRKQRQDARVQLLRENWDRLRSDELQFSSEVLKPNYRSGEDRREEDEITASISDAAIENNGKEADVSKAWKMMDKAKSACADRVPKNPSQSWSQPSKKDNGGYYNNGSYKLSSKEKARGRYNEPIRQFEPMYGGSSDMGRKREMGMVRYSQSREVFATSERRGCAKREVQTLVKLSLKGLDKDKKLGTNRFKEIAKISTHTVLAACGMEHSKSLTRPFLKVLCNHHEEIESHLLHGSCRQCFHNFLEEIVRSVFSEKNPSRVGAG